MKKSITKKFAVVVVERASEPSTWAGFAAILQAVKVLCPQYAVIIDVATAVAGAVAVAQREGAKPIGAGG